MPRKSTKESREPASLPEVPLPLSQVPEEQRAAYELEVIDDPEMFRKVLSSEDFFQMLACFPDAWWERLSLYLYRVEDDGGIMIKNATGQDKYIAPIIRHPVDRDWIEKRNGGGKYQLWLNLSSPSPGNPDRRISTTVRKYTFRVDGPPLVKEGQIIEKDGKPVTVGTVPGVGPAAGPSEAAQLMETSNKATESAMGILTHASETAIDMVKAQSAPPAVPQKDPLELAIRLIEVMHPKTTAPATDPVQTKLMEKIIDRAFAAPEVPPEKPETKLEEISGIVETFTGKTLPELARGRNAPAADPTPSWVNLALTAAAKLVEQFPLMMSERTKQLTLELQLRQYGTVPAPPNQPRLPAQVPTATATVIPISQAQAPGPPDKAQTVRMIVERICRGFDRHRDTGGDVAAAISVELGELIEAHGLEKALSDPQEMTPLLMQFPDLAGMLGERSQHAKWREYETDFLGFMQERWGGDRGEQANDEPEKKGPQPAA